MTTKANHPHPPLGWLHKLALLAALGVSAWLFLSVGWSALAPDDPRGAVSLVSHDNAAFMVVQVAALSVIAATIATLLIGVKLPDVGLFAAAFGLALTTLRGSTAEHLLITVAQGNRSLERSLAGKLAVEALIWFGVLLFAMLVSGLLTKWFLNGSRAARQREEAGRKEPKITSPYTTLADMSISECPGLSRLVSFVRARTTDVAPWLRGLATTGIVTGVAFIVFLILAAGYLPRSIQHGQVCFAVFVAFYCGVLAAKNWLPRRTPFWEWLAVPATCVLGFLWSIMQGEMTGPYAQLASVPVSDFLRALPATFVSVGTLGVLVGHWTIADGSKRPLELAFNHIP